MDRLTIILDPDTVSRMGSSSLVGTVMNGNNNTLPKSLDLVFPMTTMEWKEKNKGPRVDMVYEHTISCILRDVQWLMAQGVTVNILEA